MRYNKMNLDNSRIAVGTPQGIMRNVFVNTTTEQFQGFIHQANGDIAIHVVPFNSEVGGDILTRIKNKDAELYQEILNKCKRSGD